MGKVSSSIIRMPHELVDVVKVSRFRNIQIKKRPVQWKLNRPFFLLFLNGAKIYKLLPN